MIVGVAVVSKEGRVGASLRSSNYTGKYRNIGTSPGATSVTGTSNSRYSGF